MDSFQWDSCFVTGLAMVDEQHHKLVDLINQFGNLLMQAQGASAEDIEHLFGELANYARYHFQEEEGLMVGSGLHPNYLARHRKDHAQFLQDVTTMHASMAHASRDDAHVLLNYLTNWLAYHILGSDQRMAWLITAVKAGSSTDEANVAYQNSLDPATATLLQAMNRLFDHVSERNRALFDLNQTLEARVAERTQELENMALTDVLTGLPNRRHAMRVLENEWQNSASRGTPLACLMIDADGFKSINDTHGHDAGDEVLRQLARQLRSSVRTDDMVFRLGGDEFFIVCARTPLEGARQVAEKVRKDVAGMRVAAGDGEWRGSISVGVAVRNPAMAGMDDLLKRADEGVYAAKRNGRNCVAVA